VVCSACLLIGGLVIHHSDIQPSLRTTAALTLGVLGAGVFLLVWWVLSSTRRYVLSDLRRQSTVLHADPSRVLVESSGPLGDRSLDLAVCDILSIEATAQNVGDAPSSAAVPCLLLRMRGGQDIPLLPGHHVLEIQWVAATLAKAMGAPTVSAGPKSA
jgi:hypothetical protein